MFDNDDDGKVGYGRPPKHTRFKKGQSGNPRGRPKRSRNLQSALVRVVAEPVKVRVGDQVKAVSCLEAMVISMVHKAIKGDPKAVAWIESHLPAEQVEPEKPREDDARKYIFEKAQQQFERIAEHENLKRRERIETRALLRERGVPDSIVADALGLVDPTEAEQRHDRAVTLMRAHGIPENRIRTLLERRRQGLNEPEDEIVAPRLRTDRPSTDKPAPPAIK